MNNVYFHSNASNTTQSWAQCDECKEWARADYVINRSYLPVTGYVLHDECREARETRRTVAMMDLLVNEQWYDD